MNYSNLTIDESIDMDNILVRVLELSITKDGTCDINWLHTKFLKSKGQYYAVDIVFKILSHDPKILYTEQRNGIKTVVWATPILSDFLVKGGFTRIAKEMEIKRKNEEEKEKLNFEKLNYDVKNSKRIFKTYWLTFTMACLGLLISIILLILKFLGN